MLTRFVDHLVAVLLRRSGDLHLVPAILPISAVPQTNLGSIIREIFDGFLLATPKRRTPIRKIWSRKYGDNNWKYGTTLFKSKRNIVTCFECGSFHEVHTICRACFEKTQEQSKEAIQIKANTLWFDANLVQPTANPKKAITGPPNSEALDNTIKIKTDT